MSYFRNVTNVPNQKRNLLKPLEQLETKVAYSRHEISAVHTERLRVGPNLTESTLSLYFGVPEDTSITTANEKIL